MKTHQDYAEHVHSFDEIAMSECPSGCKIVRCCGCGLTAVEHRAIYGCQHGGQLAPKPMSCEE
jgi:hypothetical protein